MLINKTSQIAAPALRRSGKSRRTNEKFTVGVEEPVKSAISAGVSSVPSLAGLLEIQEVDDRDARSRKSRNHVADILDQLDNLRHGILLGRVTHAQLEGLSTTLKKHRETLEDPRLVELIDEVELRAQVELAKLNR